jgi:hypothetical protein
MFKTVIVALILVYHRHKPIDLVDTAAIREEPECATFSVLPTCIFKF